MSLRVGIVGLPNVGKSTLFNALLKKRVALSANYPFATVEPNTGVVAVPDERLEKLAELTAIEEGMIPRGLLNGSPVGSGMTEESKTHFPPLIPAVVEFVDIAGLVKGASQGAGLGNQFLSHIREVDAIIHVLRDFEDTDVIRAGSENPEADKITIETELALADLQTLDKLIPTQEKVTRASHDQLETQKLELLNSLKNQLDQGKVFLGHIEIGDDRLRGWFSKLPILTLKPVLYVYNVSEGRYSLILNEVKNLSHMRDQGPASESGTSPEIPRYALDDSLVISAKLEQDLADLSDEDRRLYLRELNIQETGLERLIGQAYKLLGLISYLTAGQKEVRAWTIKQGTKAPQAAGVIHTDFEKKFIRAEVVSYSDLMAAGSMKAARERGEVKTEGKEYVVQDGDVVEFLIGS